MSGYRARMPVESLRERGVAHVHLQAGPISELEMYARYRGLMMPYEIALLERLGYVKDGAITTLGKQKLATLKRGRQKEKEGET